MLYCISPVMDNNVLILQLCYSLDNNFAICCILYIVFKIAFIYDNIETL